MISVPAAVNLASRSRIREPEAACLIFGVHQQVAGLLGHPFTGGAGGDPGQAHASFRIMAPPGQRQATGPPTITSPRLADQATCEPASTGSADVR